MTNPKSAVRAALLELIKADVNTDKAPWTVGQRLWRGKDGGVHGYLEIVGSSTIFWIARVLGFGDSQQGQDNAQFICLSRNLAPGMARIILKMLDENDCNKCQGYGSWKADTSELGLCPRCTARWQEWATLLGLK